ncbi:MAG TPA: RNA pseudouridine synthase [bacterium]
MFTILYEDDALLAVNKPEGLASITERRLEAENLHKLLTAQFQQRLYIVHRLDKEASGVILFAKHAEAHQFLNDQFSNREVKKTYAALVHGSIDDDHGIFDQPIREFGSGRMGVDPSRGKESVTNFEVVKRWDKFTLIHALPITGRRHQIRVHFYSTGHPIVGDLRYGDKKVQGQFPRLMLHALRIEFRLYSGQRKTIESPLPPSFEKTMGIL